MSQQPTIVIVGASTDRSKYGNKAVRAYKDLGYRVIPVNPAGGEIEGIPARADLSSVDKEPDRVALYVPPGVGVRLMEAIAKLSPKELWVNPGAESEELLDKAKSLGLEPIQACAIVDVGKNPAHYSV